jgi:hypothetical protein
MLIYAKMLRLAKTADAGRGQRAFLEKRAPVFTGRGQSREFRNFRQCLRGWARLVDFLLA